MKLADIRALEGRTVYIPKTRELCYARLKDLPRTQTDYLWENYRGSHIYIHVNLRSRRQAIKRKIRRLKRGLDALNKLIDGNKSL